MIRIVESESKKNETVKMVDGNGLVYAVPKLSALRENLDDLFDIMENCKSLGLSSARDIEKKYHNLIIEKIDGYYVIESYGYLDKVKCSLKTYEPVSFDVYAKVYSGDRKENWDWKYLFSATPSSLDKQYNSSIKGLIKQ